MLVSGHETVCCSATAVQCTVSPLLQLPPQPAVEANSSPGASHWVTRDTIGTSLGGWQSFAGAQIVFFRGKYSELSRPSFTDSPPICVVWCLQPIIVQLHSYFTCNTTCLIWYELSFWSPHLFISIGSYHPGNSIRRRGAHWGGGEARHLLPE